LKYILNLRLLYKLKKVHYDEHRGKHRTNPLKPVNSVVD
jgi:hypothetical protein